MLKNVRVCDTMETDEESEKMVFSPSRLFLFDEPGDGSV